VSAPRWCLALLRRLAPEGREEEILGDLEEAHRARVRRRGRVVAMMGTTLETVDMALALVRQRGFVALPSLLDLKLALRMLVRYPGLTALGGLAIAFAIVAGAGTFEFLRQFAHPKLPFEDGQRMVGIQLWDARANRAQAQALFDFGVWREELTTVEELGAFEPVTRNLIVEGRGAHLVTGAAMHAAGFRVTGVEPLLGRTLVEEDERPGAPLAVVLGHAVWQSVFESDPDVLGTVVKVGSEDATVVGVMPEGFAFPVAHELWLPFRHEPATSAPEEGPVIRVFGRLAPGTSLDEARAQATAIGHTLAAAHPATHTDLRLQVRPFTRVMLGVPGPDGVWSLMAMAWNLPLALFLLLVCGNVALLLFARAATRESELVVRSALGADRRRIVAQLFTEALVLAAVGAALGLGAAGYGLRSAYHAVAREMGGPLPFWFQPELSRGTVAYTLLLALLAAVVAGVLPALKVTRGLGSQLRRVSAGAGGFRLGGVWTAVLVLQIAVTVVFPAVTLAVGLEGRDIRTFDPGVPADEYLTALVAVEPGSAGSAVGDPAAAAPVSPPRPTGVDAAAAAATEGGPQATFMELEERLLADARVLGVTFAERAPRMYNGWNQVEVDGPTKPPQDERGHRLGAVRVEVDFFETLGIEPRTGRDFHPADASEGACLVIVNDAFVDYVLGGRNAIGVHFRYVASERNRAPDQEPGPWLEVIGVVQDLGAMSGYSGAVVYHPVPPASMNPSYALVHVRGDADGFAPRLREIAFDVDPTLRIGEALRLDRIVDSEVELYRFWVRALVMGTALTVVLSLGGIYAVMAYTVARRTREIGVRVALGAPRARVLLAIFRRPLRQVALGVLLGGFVSANLMGVVGVDTTAKELATFLAYLTVMSGVCLMACVVPTRRALAIEPSDALKAE
jgi:hypothetical protein